VSRIFIVGAGVVGSATGLALRRIGHRVSFVDSDPDRVAVLVAQGLDARARLELDGEPESFIFLGLPTAIDADGYRLGAIEDGATRVGLALAGADAWHTVVVRSAVPPGTTEALIRPLLQAHSAKLEGLGFALAVSPQLRSLVVIGARRQRVAQQVRELLTPLGGAVRLFDDPATAELIKCTDSLVNATKISFWNEIWQVCRLLDLNPDQVAEAVAATAAGSRDPLYGIRGGAPYAGSLPRDTRGFLDFAAELGLPMPLLSAVVGVNTEFDWRMAAELDGIGPLSAIPLSRPEPDTGWQDDADQPPHPGRPPQAGSPPPEGGFNSDEAFRPEDDAPPLPRRPRPARVWLPARRPGGQLPQPDQVVPRIPRQRIR
jgi:UDPglucose 6-dehydrogenase